MEVLKWNQAIPVASGLLVLVLATALLAGKGPGLVPAGDGLEGLLRGADTLATEAAIRVTRVQSANHLALATHTAGLSLLEFEATTPAGKTFKGFLLGQLGPQGQPRAMRIRAKVMPIRRMRAQGGRVLVGEALDTTSGHRYGLIAYRYGSSPVAFIEQEALEHGTYIQGAQIVLFDLEPASPSGTVAVLIGL